MNLERVRDAMHGMADEVRPDLAMPDAILRRTRRRQVRTVSTGVAVIGALVVTAVVGLGAIRTPVPPPVRPAESTFAGLPTGWTELPAPPVIRADATFVWAGDRLVMLGGTAPGSSAPTRDAFALGPFGDDWSALPEAPLPEAGAGAVGVWTGREAVFFGVGDDGWHGEAYDPISSAWRVITPPPIPPRPNPMVVWTGTEMIVWGGGSRTGPPSRSGAAYDPATDTWRRIADSPIGLNQGGAAWAWPRMIVVGSSLDESNASTTETAVGAEYDPRNDTWRPLPPSDLSPQADSIVAMGRLVLAWDYIAQSQTGMFPIGSAPATWQAVEPVPLHPTECYPDTAVVENAASPEAFALLCGQAALWDRSRERWLRVAGAPTEVFRPNAASFAPADVIGAGRIALLPPTADHAWVVWAYRPTSNARTAAEIAPPTFDPAPGWNTVSTSTDPTVLDRESYPAAWAANVPFDPEDLTTYGTDGVLRAAARPDSTLQSLGPTGVAITVWLVDQPGTEVSPNANFPLGSLPPQLSEADVTDSWEGQVAPNVPEYRLWMTVDGRSLDVRVYFGTLDPSDATLAAAQAELDQLRVPAAP